MNDLSSTVDLMCSDFYDDRFKAEYIQLDIRTKRLEDFIGRYKDGKLCFKPNCDLDVLEKQLDVMKAYKAILENRSKIENIVI